MVFMYWTDKRPDGNPTKLKFIRQDLLSTNQGWVVDAQGNHIFYDWRIVSLGTTMAVLYVEAFFNQKSEHAVPGIWEDALKALDERIIR